MTCNSLSHSQEGNENHMKTWIGQFFTYKRIKVDYILKTKKFQNRTLSLHFMKSFNISIAKTWKKKLK